MEIDITDFVRTAETHDLSASMAEMGQNAGKITWANALREAATTQLIDAEHRDAFESWAREFGAWEHDEIAAWSLEECSALLLQYIAGDLNTLESLCYSDDDDFCIDWEEAERLSTEGTIGGNIYKSGDRVYFCMSN